MSRRTLMVMAIVLVIALLHVQSAAAVVVCAAGSTLNATSNACVLCPAGTFGATSNSTSPTCDGLCAMGYYCVAGSTSATAALCPAGTFGNTTGLATANCTGLCQAGYYCEAGSTAAVNRDWKCPSGSSSAAGASSLTSCQCPVGYMGLNGGECSQCPQGQYKNVVGDSICQRCPAGRYGNETGLKTPLCSGPCTANYWCDVGSVISTSVACPANSQSVNGSASAAACLCNAGFSSDYNGGTCSACTLGRYKSTVGPGKCTDCESGTYAPDATVCVDYPETEVAYSLWASQVSLMVLGPLFLLAFGIFVAVHFWQKRGPMRALQEAPKGRPKSQDSYSMIQNAAAAQHIAVPIATPIAEHDDATDGKKKKKKKYSEEPKKTAKEQVKEYLAAGDDEVKAKEAVSSAASPSSAIVRTPSKISISGKKPAIKKAAAKRAHIPAAVAVASPVVVTPPSPVAATAAAAAAAAVASGVDGADSDLVDVPVTTASAPVTTTPIASILPIDESFGVAAVSSSSASSAAIASVLAPASPGASIVVATAVTPRGHQHGSGNGGDGSVEPFDLGNNSSTHMATLGGSSTNAAFFTSHTAPSSISTSPPSSGQHVDASSSSSAATAAPNNVFDDIPQM